jgi:hypothetical protein
MHCVSEGFADKAMEPAGFAHMVPSMAVLGPDPSTRTLFARSPMPEWTT